MSREELERRASNWINGARAPRLRERPEGGKGPYEFADPPGEALLRCLRASGTPDPVLQTLLLGQAGNSAGSVGKPAKTPVRPARPVAWGGLSHFGGDRRQDAQSRKRVVRSK